MNTQSEIINKFDEVGVRVFNTKTPSIFWIEGKIEINLPLVTEIVGGEVSHDFRVWESFFKNKWRTFIEFFSEINIGENSGVSSKELMRLIKEAEEDDLILPN
jgi:hypothetical protein